MSYTWIPVHRSKVLMNCNVSMMYRRLAAASIHTFQGQEEEMLNRMEEQACPYKYVLSFSPTCVGIDKNLLYKN